MCQPMKCMKANKINLANALKEICTSKPLDSVTVSEITKKANVTRQIFYHYFLDKYELAKWIHLHDYLKVLTSLDLDEDEVISWKTISKDWLTVIEKEKSFYRNLYSSSSENQFLYLIHQHMKDSYEYILFSSLGDEFNETLHFQLEFYCIGLTLKIHDWIKSDHKCNVSDFCDLLFECMPKEIKEVIDQYSVSKIQLVKSTELIASKSEAL